MESLRRMVWGGQQSAQAASSNTNSNAEEQKAESTVAFSGRVDPEQIVKEGWLYKRSRYLQQWKK